MHSCGQSLRIPLCKHNGSLFSSWFKPSTIERVITIGSATLTLSLTGKRGLLPSYLLATLALLALTTICVALAVVHKLHKQSARLDREANRDTLLAERERASSTLDAISDAVVSIDAQAHIMHVNPAATCMLSAPSKALIGNPLSNFLSLHTPNKPMQRFDPATALAQLSETAAIANFSTAVELPRMYAISDA